MEYLDIHNNRFTQAPDGVFVNTEYAKFGYSDGVVSEKYLHEVFDTARDLSSNSVELESYIKDWPSEYHLTPKRSQLLRDFDFSPDSRVLEVGCGCGAITRFLGEKFRSVVSIEGSRARAALARKRSRDLLSVDIINAPFQVMQFKGEFDYIFCIGVFEYSSSFVTSPEPFRDVLTQLRSYLKPNGILVIAIENQFGLKYFSSCAEDHVSAMFEGIEGYPKHAGSVRTFGKQELSDRLKKEFSKVSFFYPYPDYKIPEIVLSEQFLKDAKPFELIGSVSPRDYGRPYAKKYFDERSAYRDIAANDALSFFSNSFLVFSGNERLPEFEGKTEGVIYTSNRKQSVRTKTTIERTGNSYQTRKQAIGSGVTAGGDFVIRSTEDSWLRGKSLGRTAWEQALLRNSDLGSLPDIGIWIKHMNSVAAENEDKTMSVPGSFCDATWDNCFITDGKATLFDLEWIYKKPLPLKTLFVRSAMIFLERLDDNKHGRRHTRRKSTFTLLNQIYAPHGVRISRKDIQEFVQFEAAFQKSVSLAYVPRFGISLKSRSLYLSAVARRLNINWKRTANLVAKVKTKLQNKFWE